VTQRHDQENPNEKDLSAADHTVVMAAVIENRGFLADTSGLRTHRAFGMAPAPRRLLESLQQAPGLDDAANDSVARILAHLERFMDRVAEARWTAAEETLLEDVRRVMRSGTVEERAKALRALGDKYRSRDMRLGESVDHAVAILTSGVGVIYQQAPADAGAAGPDAGTRKPGDDSVEDDCVGEDVVGAVAGGLLDGLIGAVIGAIVHSTICAI
jgi:hypothetical protein